MIILLSATWLSLSYFIQQCEAIQPNTTVADSIEYKANRQTGDIVQGKQTQTAEASPCPGRFCLVANIAHIKLNVLTPIASPENINSCMCQKSSVSALPEIDPSNIEFAIKPLSEM